MCTHEKNRWYAGVRIHLPWLMSFESFLADMGERPVGHRLERFDTSKGFDPDNCCWAPWPKRRRRLATNAPRRPRPASRTAPTVEDVHDHECHVRTAQEEVRQ
jgi:hypothetical protein